MIDEHDDHDDCLENPEAHRAAAMDRRTFLRRSLGGLITLTLGAPLLGLVGGPNGVSAVLGESAGTEPLAPKALSKIKSVILLWMDGGPPQTDLWDPKPGSASAGEFKAIQTAIKGVQFGEHLPQVAAIADRLAVIRNMTTGEGNHQRARHLLHTGFVPQATVKYPGLGAIVAESLGNSEFPMPQNVSIGAPGYKAGYLGVSYDPFFVQDPSRPVSNLAPPKGLTGERIDRRLSFLEAQEAGLVERLGGKSDEVSNHEAVTAAAVRFMRAEQVRAFDISGEPESVRAAYGNTRFGQGCLMARRLVEAGVKFVEVSLGGWDTHTDNFTRVQKLLQEMDPAMATLIHDLEARQLLESTLVLWMGEFGRTPKVNGRSGRDHFPKAWSAVVAGGGVRRGTVIGATSADGNDLAGQGVSAPDLFRTVCVASGINPDRKTITPQGRPVTLVNGGKVIPELLA